jgi:hypothetical protein
MSSRRLLAAATAGSALAGLVLAPGAAASSRPAVRLVTVQAYDPNGTAVGLVLHGGKARVQAVRGRATCDYTDPTRRCVHNADGDPRTAATGFTAPRLRAFSLVGRVGDGPFVQLGTRPTTISGEGAVRLYYNDARGRYDDNEGAFVVKVAPCRRGC